MYEIEVTGQFSAEHSLKLYDGAWEKPHSHDWKVSVVMRSEKLDSMGVVVDFEAVKPALKKALAEFDKQSINDHPDFKGGKRNPSAENVAKLIFERLSQNFKSANAKFVKVTVWEMPDASASYYE